MSPVLSWAQRVRKSKAPSVLPCATVASVAAQHAPPLPTGAGGPPRLEAAQGLVASSPAGVFGESLAGVEGWAQNGRLFLDSLGTASGGGGGGTVAAAGALYALQDSIFYMAIDGGGDGGGGGGVTPGRSRLASYQAGGGVCPALD